MKHVEFALAGYYFRDWLTWVKAHIRRRRGGGGGGRRELSSTILYPVVHARPKASELLTENYRAFARSITRYTRWSVALVLGAVREWCFAAIPYDREQKKNTAVFQPQTINRAIRSSGIDVSHYRLRWWRHRARSNWPQLIRSMSFFLTRASRISSIPVLAFKRLCVFLSHEVKSIRKRIP